MAFEFLKFLFGLVWFVLDKSQSSLAFAQKRIFPRRKSRLDVATVQPWEYIFRPEYLVRAQVLGLHNEAWTPQVWLDSSDRDTPPDGLDSGDFNCRALAHQRRTWVRTMG